MQTNMKKYIGKTIKSITKRNISSDEVVIIKFTDDSTLRLQSWDSEGYSSGIKVNEENPFN